MGDPIIHSDELAEHIRSTYSPSDLDRIETFLFERGVLSFQPLATGLFPAADGDAATIRSGYRNVWVRDNVFVAHALYVNGHLDAAVGVARGLAAFFSNHFFRFDDIIGGSVDHNDPMNRPHIRFDGASLSELAETWSHAQNDALGYFVWLFCNLAAAGAIPLTGESIALLEKFAAYFEAIRFWKNEDSGHWEEVRKISASSIGVVVGGLEAMKTVLEARCRGEGFRSSSESRGTSAFWRISFVAEGERSTTFCRPSVFNLTRESAVGSTRRYCFSSIPSASSVKRWRTGSSATSRPTCRETSEFAATSGIPIGAPTTARCFRRKREAPISVRAWNAATAC